MDLWDETERSQPSTFHFSDVLHPVETRNLEGKISPKSLHSDP